MRRISMAVALLSAVTAGCSMGGKPTGSTGNGSAKGEQGVFYFVNIFQPPIGGVITSNIAGTPAAIDCGATGVTVNNAVTPPQYVYATGTHAACGTAGQTRFAWAQTVVLTATPDAGKAFYGWAGDCQGTGPTCTLTAGADKTVVAIFGVAGQGHGNFMDGAVHGAAYEAGVLDCTQCHGSELQGQGIAPACASCHGGGGINPQAGNPESCRSCHSSGTLATATVHAISGNVIATAGPVTFTAGTPATISFTVNVKVDGVNSDTFTGTPSIRRLAYNSARVAATVIAPYERFSLVAAAANDGFTVAPQGGGTGNYLVTITDGTVASAASGLAQKYLVNLATAAFYPGSTTVPANVGSVVANLAGTNARDLISNQACVNCHGDQVFREREANGEWHHGANPYGGEACVICHTRYGSISRSAGGDRTTAYVHGVHNSTNMPARSITASLGSPATPYTVLKEAGVYARNDSLLLNTTVTPNVATISSPWSVGFPGYLINCSICHDTPARLTAIMAMPVTFSTCMSCHDDWNGFPTFEVGTPKYAAKLAANASWATVVGNHTVLVRPAATTATADTCATAGCHDGTAAFNTVGGIHTVRITERNGVVYKGQDLSITQGDRVVLAITGTSYDAQVPPKLAVTWTATLDGAPINPCNTNIATGPVFMNAAANAATGQSASNMSLLQAFAQGNDWVNAGVGATPGQPASAPTLSMTATPSTSGYTTCAANVATSYITAPATTASRGVVALQGKPQMTFTDGTFSRVIQLRSTSPVREFVPGTGASPATLRRQIVSTDKCLACHPGSLYQHGGNRVDSNDLCVMCHNPASNEKWYRSSTLGLTAAGTYDGKVGETIDMRTMVHAIHSAGETGKALVYYRSNGAYFFGNKAALAANTLWPTSGGVSCMNAEGNEVNYYRVPGSATTGSVPSVNADGTCNATGGGTSTNGTWLVHNFIEVHYPRALNDCSACHVGGSEIGFGNQAERMAVTVDPGTVAASSVPINGNQLDDVLRGAGAQSCLTCHQSGDAATQAALQAHGNLYGFAPRAMPGSRADLVACALGDATKCP